MCHNIVLKKEHCYFWGRFIPFLASLLLWSEPPNLHNLHIWGLIESQQWEESLLDGQLVSWKAFSAVQFTQFSFWRRGTNFKDLQTHQPYSELDCLAYNIWHTMFTELALGPLQSSSRDVNLCICPLPALFFASVDWCGASLRWKKPVRCSKLDASSTPPWLEISSSWKIPL